MFESVRKVIDNCVNFFQVHYSCVYLRDTVLCVYICYITEVRATQDTQLDYRQLPAV